MSERSKELREIDEVLPIPRERFYSMIRSAHDRRDQRLMAAFFLMANRCSEGLAVLDEDIHKEVAVQILDEELTNMASQLGRLRTELDVGKTLKRDVDKAEKDLGILFDEYQLMSDLKKRFYIPAEKVDISDEIARRYPQTLVYVVKLVTLKRKKRVPRNIPVPIVDPLAPLFVEAVENMGRSLFESPQQPYGSITRQRAWQLLTDAGVYAFYRDQDKMVPKNPLRHARLSEVSNVLNRVQLDRYAGWKIKGTADHYIHLRWDDFMGPLVRVARAAPPFK